MAMLDDIRTGRLLRAAHCSIYEAAVHLMINQGMGSSDIVRKLMSASSDIPSENNLLSVVGRLGALVNVWSAFREITELAESVEYAKGKLVTVRHETAGQPLEHYLDDAGWAIEIPNMSVPDHPDHREVVREGLVSLAAIKWYLVRTRHLLGSVGTSHREVDWFWSSFGEFHHFDVIKLRNSLVHATESDGPSACELKRQISWFSDWLTEFSRKIRRTSVAVPDANGNIALRFSTDEMSRLPRIDDQPRSAANALLIITIEHNLSNEHSLSLGVVPFDPETRVLRAPDGGLITSAVLT